MILAYAHEPIHEHRAIVQKPLQGRWVLKAFPPSSRDREQWGPDPYALDSNFPYASPMNLVSPSQSQRARTESLQTLSAGGRWIRTFGSARGGVCIARSS